MTIKIDLFEFPTKEEMAPLLKESPLYSYRIKETYFVGLGRNLLDLI